MDGDTNIKTINMNSDCGDRVFTLYQQYKIYSKEKFFSGGDSGSAVYIECNCDYRLLGILGGDKTGRHYYDSPITAVLHALGENIKVKDFPNHEPMDIN